jgi:uncharacterized membrane protein
MSEENSNSPDRLNAVQAYFRDEMRRAVGWRHRLDQTSNWAVVLTASLLTWAFSKPDNPHFVILIAVACVTFFLIVEAGRYRRYDVWRSRIRLIEREILAPLFDDGCRPRSDCWKLLAADLVEPSHKIPFLEALQRRLRRIYWPLLTLLVLAWVVKVGNYSDADQLIERARFGFVAGEVLVAAVAAYALAFGLLLVWPLKRRAMEELSEEDIASAAWQEKGSREDR